MKKITKKIKCNANAKKYLFFYLKKDKMKNT